MPMTESAAPERLLVLAPTGRDAKLTCSLLAKAGLDALRCNDMTQLRAEAERGAAGLLIAEEALTPSAVRTLVELLASQEPWSDLPLIVFRGEAQGFDSRRPTPALLATLGN